MLIKTLFMLLTCCLIPIRGYNIEPDDKGIIAYDCSNEASNVTVVSINSVSQCMLDEETLKEEKDFVTIIQLLDTKPISVTSCKITRSLFISHCGMHSHASVSRHGFIVEEILSVTKEQCNDLYERGIYTLNNGYTLTKIPRNALFHREVVEAGSIDDNHVCNGVSYFRGDKTWTNVVVQASYKFLTTKLDGTLLTESSKISVNSGYQYDYSTGYSFDSTYGYLYWDTIMDIKSCGSVNYGILYEGPAIFFSDNTTKTLTVNTSEHAIALDVLEETILCNNQAYKTEHPKLWVVRGDRHNIPVVTIKSEDIDMFLYTNAKIVYVANNFKNDLLSLYKVFHKRTCELKNTQLNSLISLAYINPEQFAWNYAQRPGIAAIVGGEAIYLMSCKPVIVRYRQTDRCYQEFPVLYNNKTSFIKPKTHILVDHGTETQCSIITPSLFQFDKTWIELSPHLRVSKEPRQISVDYDKNWRSSSISNLFRSGLYTESQLSTYRERILFPMQQTAIQNTINNAFIGGTYDKHNIDLRNLISEKTFEHIKEGFLVRIYGKLWSICIFFSSIAGVVFCFTTVKGLLSMFLNGTLLYKTFGMSYKLLAVFWGTLAKHCIYSNIRYDKPNTNKSENLPNAPVQEIEELIIVSDDTNNTNKVIRPVYPKI